MRLNVLAFIFGTNINNESKDKQQEQQQQQRATRKKTPQKMARKTSFVVLEHVRDRSKFALYGAAAAAAVSAAAATPCKIQDTLSVFVSERNKIQQLML